MLAGQLVKYKRPDVAIEAFNKNGKRLVVIGEGEEFNQLAALAGPNIELLGRVPYEELKSCLSSCRALVFPGEEDFGIVPVEAMASGTPVIALGRGGALDTVKDGETGVLFDRPDPECLNDAIARFERIEESFDRTHLVTWAEQFSIDGFKSRIRELVEEKLRET